MKVLHLGKFYPPAKGGMEAIVQLICRETSRYVHNRVLVANDRFARVEEKDADVEIVRLPVIARIGAVAVCPGFPLQLTREEADIVLLHEPNPMALVAYFLARPAGKLIVWFHSEVIRPSWRYRLFYRPFLQFALSRATRIVVSSPALAKTAPALREWQEKCVVIPFGVEKPSDIGAAETAARADAIRREIDRPIVLFVGRLVPYKGVDVLLDAMRTISAELVLVGGGPLRAELQRKAESAGIIDRVRFAGEVTGDELAALYRACDLFVLPSVTRQEAFGVVQIEAMARGKPVVSTSVGTGVDWVNRDGETGLVVPPGDAPALGAAIDRLLRDPLERQKMGAAGQERARSVFAVDTMVNSVLSLYHDVTGEYARRQTVA
ncbi:MAG TPA: glycosyltransferase [Vicinamibacterales bacterium]|nr:glycosyltransferase [Vicinamibacterales bacterium]